MSRPTGRRHVFPFVPVILATALGLGAAMLGSTALAAERVELRDGRTLVGEISKLRDGSVAVHTGSGTEIVPKEQVLRIVPFDRKRDAADGADSSLLRRLLAPEPDPRAPDAGDRKPAHRFSEAQIRTLRAELAAAAEDDGFAASVVDVLELMESTAPEQRVAALETITTGWPESRAIVRVVLTIGSDQARLDSARLLSERKLGDTSDLCDRAVRDRSPTIRILALRAIREKQLVSFEPLARDILSGEGVWAERQEASRTLEKIGGPATFSTAVQVWSKEFDPARKRRLKRLLRAIAGTDLGDEPGAWTDAVMRASVGDLKLRTPEDRRLGRSPGIGSTPAKAPQNSTELPGEAPTGGDEE